MSAFSFLARVEHRSQEEARLILLYRWEIAQRNKESCKGHTDPSLLSPRLAIGGSLAPTPGLYALRVTPHHPNMTQSSALCLVEL